MLDILLSYPTRRPIECGSANRRKGKYRAAAFYNLERLIVIREDILQFLSRHAGYYTATQIADSINSSNGRVNTLLRELCEDEIVICDTRVELKGADTYPYNTRIYLVWTLNTCSDNSTVE